MEEEYVSLAISVLEDSFDLVAPRGDELVERFYDRLFATAPELRSLFGATDMARQRQMLLGALVLLRKSLRNLESIVPALQALGARHATYGVLPEHYPIVGAALLDTMAKIGGSAWLPKYTQAWADAYQVVQDAMLSGVNGSPGRKTDEALAASSRAA
jgi:hemoglobin-like flavoprotein